MVKSAWHCDVLDVNSCCVYVEPIEEGRVQLVDPSDVPGLPFFSAKPSRNTKHNRAFTPLCFALCLQNVCVCFPPKAHREEEDPERLAHLLDKGEQNLRFVLRKYKMSEPRPPQRPATSTTATKTGRRRRRATATLRAAADREERGVVPGPGGEGDSDNTWTPGR